MQSDLDLRYGKYSGTVSLWNGTDYENAALDYVAEQAKAKIELDSIRNYVAEDAIIGVGLLNVENPTIACLKGDKMYYPLERGKIYGFVKAYDAGVKWGVWFTMTDSEGTTFFVSSKCVALSDNSVIAKTASSYTTKGRNRK